MAVIQKNEIKVPFLGSRLSFIRGQDPMGMLNISDNTFSLLLPGLNNVTDRIRYYGFYCWFFDLYAKINGSLDQNEQRKYLRRAEYLIAIIAAKQNVDGVAGITEARKNYSEKLENINLKEGTGELKESFENTYWLNPGGVFGQNYVSSMRQLGLIRDKGEDTGIFIRTAFELEDVVSGKQLAEAFNHNLEEESVRIFSSALKSGQLSRTELDIIDPDFNMKKVPLNSGENTLLINILIGKDHPIEENMNLFRRTTCKHYFNNLANRKSSYSSFDFVMDAYANQGKINGTPDSTFTAWYYFQLDQFWHMVSTGILSAMLTAIREKSDGGWYSETQLITELSDEITANLAQMGYLEKYENSLSSIKSSDMDELQLSNQVRKGQYVDRLSSAVLLLRLILVRNETKIDELKRFAKEYDLVSYSNFGGVYNDLNKYQDKSTVDFLTYFIKKYIIFRHQYVALRKMNWTQSTEKFLREDGLIRLVNEIDFGFSGPRLPNLISFLTDLGLITDDHSKLTAHGSALREKLNE